MRSRDDLDIAVERGQKTHQAIDRVFAEIARERARDLRLADTPPRPGGRLARANA
jgi:hypothetical protein